MACKYYYNGLRFDSEEELDDYLAISAPLRAKLGDVVFSKQTKKLTALLLLLLDLFNNKSKKLSGVSADFNYNSVNSSGEIADLDPMSAEKPTTLDNFDGTISVTDMIQNMETINNTLVSPKFIEDEYWKNQGAKYMLGIFSDPYSVLYFYDLLTDKNGVLFNTPEEAVEAVRNDNIAPINLDTVNIIRSRMSDNNTGVWKQLALCGTLIHNIFADFFKHNFKGKIKYAYKMDKGPSNVLSESIKYRLDDMGLFDAFKNLIKSDSHYADYRRYIDDATLRSIIVAAIQMNDALLEKYPDAIIRTEQKIDGLAHSRYNNNTFNVLGSIDLLVVDKEGKTHVFDYKVSPKLYAETNVTNDPFSYNSAKVRTFMYLLAMYRRMLALMGINLNDIDINVIPIYTPNFKYDASTKRVNLGEVKLLKDIFYELPNSKAIQGVDYLTIERNLSQYFTDYSRITPTKSDTEIILNVTEFDKKCFPERSVNYDEEFAKQYIKRKHGVKKNKINGKYLVVISERTTLTSDKTNEDEATIDLINLVILKFKLADEDNMRYAANLRDDVAKGVTGGEIGKEFIEKLQEGVAKNSKTKVQLDWIKVQLGKYFTGAYELYGSESLRNILDLYGIFLLRNRFTKVVDVIRFNKSFDFNASIPMQKGNTILGNFLPDYMAKNSQDSEVLSNTRGNMLLMETMNLLDLIPNLFLIDNTMIGEIKVLNPSLQTGIFARNHLLLANYKVLCALLKLDSNFLYNEDDSNKIKMADDTSLVLAELLNAINEENDYGIKRTVINAIDQMLLDINESSISIEERPQLLRTKFTELLKQIINSYNFRVDRTDDASEAHRLYDLLGRAITELNGVQLVQQLEDHSLVSNLINNPGTLESTALNQFTKLVSTAYLKVRDIVTKENEEIRARVIKLQKSKSFGWFKLNTFGSQILDLYINMYDPESEDLALINPFNSQEVAAQGLNTEQVEFMKYFLEKMIPIYTKRTWSEVKKGLLNNDPNYRKYLVVPLFKGGWESSAAASGGILNFIKGRFLGMTEGGFSKTIERVKDYAVKEATNLTSDENLERVAKGDQWEAINNIKSTYNPDNEDTAEYRKKLLTNEALGGKSYYEHNLETILLLSLSAKAMEELLNNVFPTMRAINLFMLNQGAILNTNFINDETYAIKYVLTRVHNLPYELNITKGHLARLDIIHSMMRTASKIALAWNPKLLYLFIDGIWKDIMVFVKFNGLEYDFSSNDLRKAWVFVITHDLFHTGLEKTFCQLLNELYGFNDMDMNTYIDKIKSDNTGFLYHFWDTGFRFASRPDYYNRLTLFLALAMHDGTIKISGNKIAENSAYNFKDGKLTYDWKLDDRFKDYNSKDAKKKGLALSNIIAVSKLLSVEDPDYVLNIKNPNITKAYSSKDIESLKAFTDRIYGYYTHEQKSMICSLPVGGMLFQMNTFWSAKYNQYLQKHTYTQEGRWLDYAEMTTDELGNPLKIKYYYKIDDDGNLTTTTEDTGIAVKLFVGLPLEGIGQTLLSVVKGFTPYGDAMLGKIMSGKDIDSLLRRLYLSNLRLLLYDLGMWILMGMIVAPSLAELVKEHIKDNPNEELGNAITNTSLYLGSSMFASSVNDFNFLKSLLFYKLRGVNLTPFSISAMSNLYDKFSRVIIGDKDFGDAVVQSFAGLNAIEPMMNYVKLNTVGREIGQSAKSEEE